MENKIYLRDLQCYIKASDEEKQHPLICTNRCFDIAKLPTQEIGEEMAAFISDRGNRLTALSIRAEFYPYNLFCEFLCEQYPEIKTIREVELAEMEKKAKVWLMKKGKNITQKRYRLASDKDEITDSDLIKYIRKIYAFVYKEDKTFNYDDDRWYLKDIPLVLKDNPTKTIQSISFAKMKNESIKHQIKKVIYLHLSTRAVGTVAAEMTAINRFCKYLKEHYPDVNSLSEVDRELLENYLIHTNTEACGRKSYSKELCHLKSVFITAGKVLEDKKLERLFYSDDIGKVPEKIFRTYSDAELVRLNSAIVDSDEQVARVLFLHQLLGTRISETLTLKRNAVYKGKSGKWMIKIHQIKSRKTYAKAINEDVKRLFDKACEYTYELYGETEYVFVSDKEPDKPMQYSRIQYQIMAMVTKNDLKDDTGERFGVGTHIWRHSYGKKLTELHVDDITISKLMGHANTSSLKHYRKVGNEMMSKETQKMRESMDELLTNIISEW